MTLRVGDVVVVNWRDIKWDAYPPVITIEQRIGVIVGIKYDSDNRRIWRVIDNTTERVNGFWDCDIQKYFENYEVDL
jgi:hypothetical protein